MMVYLYDVFTEIKLFFEFEFELNIYAEPAVVANNLSTLHHTVCDIGKLSLKES